MYQRIIIPSKTLIQIPFAEAGVSLKVSIIMYELPKCQLKCIAANAGKSCNFIQQFYPVKCDCSCSCRLPAFGLVSLGETFSLCVILYLFSPLQMLECLLQQLLKEFADVNLQLSQQSVWQKPFAVSKQYNFIFSLVVKISRKSRHTKKS